MEDLGLGRVQVLGPGVAQRPAAEAHDPAALVGDREHQAVAEMGKGLAALVGLDQTGREQLGVAEALPLERLAQPLALVGRVAQLEGADGRPVEPAPLEIGHRLPAGRAGQLGLEPGRRGGVGGVQPLAGLGLRLATAPCGGVPQAGELGQPVQRVAEAQALELHDEVDGGAVGAAAEAMIEALVLDHVERGRLLLVERAQAQMLAPAPRQLDVAADDLDQRQAGLEFLEREIGSGQSATFGLLDASGHHDTKRSIRARHSLRGTLVTRPAHFLDTSSDAQYGPAPPERRAGTRGRDGVCRFRRRLSRHP